MKLNKKLAFKLLAGLVLAVVLVFVPVFSRPADVYGINIQITTPGDEFLEDGEVIGNTATLQILFIGILIALLPSILVVMTSFTRTIIVFSFARSALGTQQMPPNMVLIGLALFLTMFVMAPQLQQINENALQPFAAGEISQDEAIQRFVEPLREFMLAQRGIDERIAFFAAISGTELTDNPADIPNYVLIPAFILNELAIGFFVGVFVFVPFLIVDMVVASVLMAMGMMMLPPAMISLPFKVLLFVLSDGWRLLVDMLLTGFPRYG